MLRFFLVTAFFVFTAFFAEAQRFRMTAQYSMAQPLGTFNDYYPSYSGRGGHFSLEYFIMPEQLSVSLTAGVNDFKLQTSIGTGPGGNIPIGTSTKVFPMMVQANYYLPLDWALKPYVGLGGGQYYFTEEVFVGYDKEEINEGSYFGFVPELGFYHSLTETIELNLGFRYNHVFVEGENLQFLQFNFGLAYRFVKYQY
ncbi:hypothetical protein PEPS_07030 [Persicobacter psychrovividus]|uniref:Outer membrane protein beta-barrel domain-containing protein n=2 Tax=Persicobacter psychrovividus TaxID=387638 RepID=A0ABM7VBW0_9BACT|nr:hypothetical protein PEPS_07030 [Persicobacter psychrovividus]